uniref:uncharacterized protein LOC122608404 n=1 Tax=Erigeron canadensis TaxID=72917 RepID=UPI001CB94ECF|nr:uncharacterized protein LOC122608404 [Erigeron canadensis]
MDVAPAMDFDFNLSSYSYTSAPSSPTRLTELYHGLDELLISPHAERNSCIATVPFAWEEKPGVPKTPENLYEDDFSFDVSSHFNKSSVSAEDLFHGGVIKTVDSPSHKNERERGRERGFSSASRLPSSRSRRTRSLSPLGASDHRREQMVTPSTTSSSENGFKKWSFMDFLLFRSSSDGRAMDKDPLKKYSENFRKHDQVVRNSGSMSRRRGRLSAHELHYNVNRAVSNDMKKKTYLPYKQGILGRFSFNP